MISATLCYRPPRKGLNKNNNLPALYAMRMDWILVRFPYNRTKNQIRRNMIQHSAFNPLPGGVFKKVVSPAADGSCDGCGVPMAARGRGIRIPGLRGVYCSMECIETGLFGHQACRWCGEMMEKTYSSLDSRLCSGDCSLNYRAHILGDHTAALGTGQRFIKWLQRNRPAIYRELVSANI